MDFPNISIATPCYNRTKWLPLMLFNLKQMFLSGVLTDIFTILSTKLTDIFGKSFSVLPKHLFYKEMGR